MAAIRNSPKVKQTKMTVFESMPGFGKAVCLYYPNSFYRISSLGNASSARMPAIASKVIAIFGG
jgi:hypothetical protein